MVEVEEWRELDEGEGWREKGEWRRVVGKWKGVEGECWMERRRVEVEWWMEKNVGGWGCCRVEGGGGWRKEKDIWKRVE